MKKLVVALLLVTSFTMMYGQKSNVSRAKNKALIEENPDFKGARELINAALQNDETKNDANTWYVAGLIGYQQNVDMEKKSYLGQAVNPDTVGTIIMQSYNYFIEADKLDQLPNEKGKVKPRFRKDIKKMIGEYYKYNFINYGAHLFDQRKYKESYDVFEVYLGVPDLPLMENSVVKDTTYRMIEYFAAIAATNVASDAARDENVSEANEYHDKAIALYEDLKGKGHQEISVYQLLADEYLNKKDTANYVKTLREAVGKKEFAKELWFIQNLINHYILVDQKEEAMKYLDTAIKANPLDENSTKEDATVVAQFYFVEGGLQEAMGDVDKAVVAYNKALELDTEQAGVYESLGRIHYNKAIALGDNDKLANEEFKLAIPYYENAVRLKPDEQNYSVLLRTLYYRLGMDREYEKLDKEMKVNFPNLYR